MMFRTERLEIRLSEDDQNLLDQQRGDRTRSAYIRDLIHGDTIVVNDVNVIHIEPPDETIADEKADLLGPHTDPLPFPAAAPFEQSQADPQAPTPPATVAAQEEPSEPPKRSRPSSRTPDPATHRHRPQGAVNRWTTRGVQHTRYTCECGKVVER